jgi:hypothetical protein
MALRYFEYTMDDWIIFYYYATLKLNNNFFFSTKGLFLKYLERLEKDYNPEDYQGNLTEEVS